MMALIAFPFMLMLVFPVFRLAVGVLSDIGVPIEELSEGTLLCLATTVHVALAYALTRPIYRAARWQWVEYDGTSCPKCEYDLTGNISGICPECGLSLPETPEATG